MPTYHGGCLCGQTRYQVRGEPISTTYCHCRTCQRHSGAPVVAWVTFPIESFLWVTGTSSGYRASASGERRFCSACGSCLALERTDAAQVSINVASIDNPNAFPPGRHQFAESRISWFHTVDDLPVHYGHGPLGVE
jgi:hypothetical protein